jgi:threonylcarbamoyladenosine tRNA methylthiotransferase MtaB
MRVHFTSLGCKLNQAEVERLARRFVASGHQVVDRLEEADLHVVNSCTVTHLAARDSRKAAGRAIRQGSAQRTVLTGCYAAAEPEEAARLAGVDLVVSNEEKEHLVERVEVAFPELAGSSRDGRDSLVPCAPLLPGLTGENLGERGGRTRALIKIEDGCNMRCAFCIIPSTRGRQRSRPPHEIVAEARDLVAAGYREIVLTGVQISAYGFRAAGEGGAAVRLAGLVRALLAETDVPRLRLTSIAPWDVDEELLDLWRDRRLARHLHLSLQSGSTATLKRMRRPYSAAGYLATVEEVKGAIPGVAVTTDVIAGFPGESEDELAESLATVEAAGFAKVHVFPFSPRPGTEAATLPGRVPPEVRKARMGRLLALARRAERAFEAAHVGAQATVLWERPKGGMGYGLTDNYLRVLAPEGAALRNRFSRVRLVEVAEEGLRGELLAAPLP